MAAFHVVDSRRLEDLAGRWMAGALFLLRFAVPILQAIRTAQAVCLELALHAVAPLSRDFVGGEVLASLRGAVDGIGGHRHGNRLNLPCKGCLGPRSGQGRSWRL